MARSLWMGDLEPYMDELFVSQAFQHVSNPSSVKIIRRKDNGMPAGYCFVEFATDTEAERVLKLVNGTNIPNATPFFKGKKRSEYTKRFRLNRSQAGKNWDLGPSFSIFVGDLDASVTDDKLEDFFLKHYRSVKGAKIMYEEGGISRGYGFVRFSDEKEHKRALAEMQGARGLGAKAIRVSIATPKGKLATATHTAPTATEQLEQLQYNQQLMQQYADNQYQYYQHYYNNYYNYPQYNYYQSQQQQLAAQSQTYQQQPAQAIEHFRSTEHYQAMRQQQDKLEDPNPVIDIDIENEIYITEHSSLLDYVLGSHWQALDSLTSKIPELNQVS